MKSKLTIVSAIVAILSLGFVFLSTQARGQGAENPSPAVGETIAKWQHLAVQHDTSKPFSTPELAGRINKLGEEGWEMFNVLNFQEEGTTTKTVYYFKRPL